MMDNIELRLQNTETALIALYTLIANTLPSPVKENVDRLMNEYFDAAKKLRSRMDGLINTP